MEEWAVGENYISIISPTGYVCIFPSSIVKKKKKGSGGEISLLEGEFLAVAGVSSGPF